MLSPWLQELTGKCRFPLGDDRPFKPCLEPTGEHRIYCPDHKKLCITGILKPPGAARATRRGGSYRPPNDEVNYVE